MARTSRAVDPTDPARSEKALHQRLGRNNDNHTGAGASSTTVRHKYSESSHGDAIHALVAQHCSSPEPLKLREDTGSLSLGETGNKD